MAAAWHTGAQCPQRAAPCAERRAPSARLRSGSPQAPGAQREAAPGLLQPGAEGLRGLRSLLAGRTQHTKRSLLRWDMLPRSDKFCARCRRRRSCSARCSRGSVQGVLRAPAEGEGGVARAPAEREYLSAAAHDHRSASQRRAPCTGNAGRNAPARQVVSVHVVDPRPRDYEAELDSAALTIRRPADVMTRA